MKRRKIKICWTCCDYCHKEHRSKLGAIMHGRWIYIKRKFKKGD